PDGGVNIDDAHLSALVGGLLAASDSEGALRELLTTIENASTATRPSAGDWSAMATYFGFPLAVARLQVLLDLDGYPRTAQDWASLQESNDGGITAVEFPVELGACDLYDDGLVAWADDDSSHVHSPYATSSSGYVISAPLQLRIGEPGRVTVLM